MNYTVGIDSGPPHKGILLADGVIVRRFCPTPSPRRRHPRGLETLRAGLMETPF
nr:hypothetical protein [Klebsiella pneumoniae subsp. pneumoniae]